jgi:hypothetical protein
MVGCELMKSLARNKHPSLLSLIANNEEKRLIIFSPCGSPLPDPGRQGNIFQVNQKQQMQALACMYYKCLTVIIYDCKLHFSLECKLQL